MPLSKPNRPLSLYLLAVGVVLSFTFIYVQTESLKSEILLSREGNQKGRAVLCQDLAANGGDNELCHEPAIEALIDKRKPVVAPNSAGTNLGVSLLCDWARSDPAMWAKYQERCVKATQPSGG